LIAILRLSISALMRALLARLIAATAAIVIRLAKIPIITITASISTSVNPRRDSLTSGVASITGPPGSRLPA